MGQFFKPHKLLFSSLKNLIEAYIKFVYRVCQKGDSQRQDFERRATEVGSRSQYAQEMRLLNGATFAADLSQL